LVFDDNDNLWIGTKEGIDKFSTQKYYKIIQRFDEMENQLVANKLQKFKHYGFLEGFVGSETNINAVCKDREGNLWFGTRRGAMKYIPAEDKVNKLPPTIQITSIHVFSDKVPISVEVVLNNNQNYLTFSFIGISHTLPKKVAYKYKLVGFDKQWVFNSFSNTASYENLAPGIYEFLVKSSNADGVWNDEPARLNVEIMPPFWKTNWFYLSVAVLLAALVYLIIRLRLKNLKRMTTLLEVEVQRKTKELRLSEHQYRTLFEKISDSIFIFEKDAYYFLDCNETAVDNYGYSKEEIRAMTPFDLHPENELEKVEELIDSPTAGVPNYYTHVTKSGKEIQVEIASDDLEYLGKKAMISIVRDVTERRRAEEDIKKMNKELTSSIRYTKRILDSVLQSKENFKNIFQDSFVLYKPRGIVSGDFYWFCEVDNKVILAVMDCTGHGLAGAFLSMVGNGLLNKVVLDNKIIDPASILKELHEGIVSALNKEEKDSFTLDGMDMGICVVDKKNKMLEASSASRPVVLVRKNKYQVIRGRKKLPIGLALGDEREYKTEKLPFKKGDSIYMLTDGYCDQFGGKDNEKFMAERFLNLLVNMQGLSMADQGAELENVIEEWKGKRKQLDDILVVGFRL
jgi:PAS domain S-box-containing protein